MSDFLDSGCSISTMLMHYTETEKFQNSVELLSVSVFVCADNANSVQPDIPGHHGARQVCQLCRQLHRSC